VLNKTHLKEEKTAPLISYAGGPEKAILVGLKHNACRGQYRSDSLDELESLAESAGACIAGTITQDIKMIDPAFFIGRGKVSELEELIKITDAELVIFDEDLSPAQQRNLEDVLSITVIDRTGLILDIFSQRARSREGKLQVELAQLSYLLPRLRGKGMVLSRLGGGIGTRGPGETKLEMDRRKIKERMARLKKDLEQVKKVRTVQRRTRKCTAQHLAALIGYTNAGKSTLINTLSDAHVEVADRLFSTLDPTIRKLPGVSQMLISDTVGFIRKLPHQLIAAFKATLEEVTEAALLLHIIDISSPGIEEQVESVNAVLQEIGIHEKDTLYVLNKIDRISEPGLIGLWQRRLEPAVAISAKTSAGIPELYAYLDRWISLQMPAVCFRLPLSEGRTIDQIYRRGTVIRTEYRGQTVLLEAHVDEQLASALKRFSIPRFRKKSATGNISHVHQ
jgi:GTP-binding protein HflX